MQAEHAADIVEVGGAVEGGVDEDQRGQFAVVGLDVIRHGSAVRVADDGVAVFDLIDQSGGAALVLPVDEARQDGRRGEGVAISADECVKSGVAEVRRELACQAGAVAVDAVDEVNAHLLSLKRIAIRP